MRFEAVRAIYEYGMDNKNTCFITGDYGHADIEKFRRDFGDRYFNGGMSEQNIMGVAAGMAISGLKVATYSIVPFITLRCFEQIKIDVCEQNADVVIIGGGGGFAYESAGASHYSIEELAALSALPNMKIAVPADPREAYELTKQLLELGGPGYVRIGRGKEPPLSIQEYPVKFGKGVILREGSDITIFASGTIVAEALRAAELLAKDNINAEVVNIHTIKPLDEKLILDRVRGRAGIFVLEEHNLIGGLGSAIAATLLEGGIRPNVFKRFGVPDAWPKKVGTQQYLRDYFGLSSEKIADSVKTCLNKAQ